MMSARSSPWVLKGIIVPFGTASGGFSAEPVVSPRNCVITGKPSIWLSFISIMGMCDPSAYFVDHYLKVLPLSRSTASKNAYSSIAVLGRARPKTSTAQGLPRGQPRFQQPPLQPWRGQQLRFQHGRLRPWHGQPRD